MKLILGLRNDLFANCTRLPKYTSSTPPTPKFYITFVCHFTWVLQLSQNWTQCQFFFLGVGGGGEGETRCIMGDVEIENYDKLNQEAFKKNQEKKERRQGLFYETLSKLWIKWRNQFNGNYGFVVTNFRILCAQYLVYLFATSPDVNLATKFIHRHYQGG